MLDRNEIENTREINTTKNRNISKNNRSFRQSTTLLTNTHMGTAEHTEVSKRLINQEEGENNSSSSGLSTAHTGRRNAYKQRIIYCQ